MSKRIAVRRILRGATPIDYGLSVAVAVIIAVTAWGTSGQGPDQPVTVTAAVQA